MNAKTSNESASPAQSTQDYRLGGLDKRGRIVRDIHWSTGDFVIFQHDDGISPHFSDDLELSQLQRQRYIQLGPYLSRINSLLPPFPTSAPHEIAKPQSWTFFHTPDKFLYRETARAIAAGLTGEQSRAISILRFVETRLLSRRRALGQFQYLLACTGAVLTIVAIALGIEYFAKIQSNVWRDLIRVVACGAIGGFLSIAMGIRKVDLDPDTRYWVKGFYAVVRLAIAIASAGVLYLLIKGKLVLQPIFGDSLSTELFALYAFAAAAGFSETLVPNLLRAPDKNPEESRIPQEPIDTGEYTEATRPPNAANKAV